MSNFLAAGHSSLPPQAELGPDDLGQNHDPFSSSTNSHHRFSHFDQQLFALGPATSPEQAKRALASHLAETERRIQEASKLGTTLVQQRKELSQRLKEVEEQQTEGDITPELRQKLVEIEKEYNEVGLDSARAFLPKSRVSSAEMAGSPFTGGDAKRSVSPSKFESQGTSSPSKLSVPNRKQRNQPSNRVHDIEFATEISTSLLGQVRHLQALLAEKEDALKEVTYERSRLEAEAEGFNQRLRALDESEQRYKDENWNLETQIHEFIAKEKEAADKEKKLTQSLNLAQLEKSSAQKELDEIKLGHARLSEDHAAALKHYDVELGTVKRNMTMAENERATLQRKVDDLTGQNQELAKAVTYQRGRLEDRDQARGLSDEDFETAPDNVTPEHSPPPSPIKGTPRHSMLESETLKSSLHHAHRMIQNLKGTIHREKTEKNELKRMLQDARDELESNRHDGAMGSAKRSRKVESKEFKKPLRPGQLGGVRTSRSEIFVDDTNWEEDHGQASPSASLNAARAALGAASTTDSSDHFDTANESADAFETANERGTETEDFQTGHEDISGSDELTETEGVAPSTIRNKPTPLALMKPGNRNSWQSTASGSGDEYSYEGYEETKTPTAQPQRLRLKLSRGINRRTRAVSEDPFPQGSPASFASSSQNGTPQPAGQSLFAELADMSDEDGSFQGTPSRSAYTSQSATPASRPSTARGTPMHDSGIPPVPKLPMVDSGTMTEKWDIEPETPVTATPATPLTAVERAATPEPVAQKAPMVDSGMLTEIWEPEQVIVHVPTPVAADVLAAPEPISTPMKAASMVDSGCDARELEPVESKSNLPALAGAVLGGAALTEIAHSSDHQHEQAKELVTDSDTANQPHGEDSEHLLRVNSQEGTRPISMSMYSDRSSQYDPEAMEEKLAKFPSPPTTGTQTPQVSSMGLEARPASLTLSAIYSESVEPKSPITPVPSPLTMSSIYYEHVEPKSPARPVTPTPAPLTFSVISSEHVEPRSPVKLTPAPLTMSTIYSEHVEPISPVQPITPSPAPLTISSISSEHVEPKSPVRPVTPQAAPLTFSTISSEHVEPKSPSLPKTPPRAPLTLSTIYSETFEPQSPIRPATPPAPLLSFSTISSEFVVPESPKLPASPKRVPTPIKLASPPLVLSSIQALATEPIEPAPPRSPQHDAVIIASDKQEPEAIEKEPQTPKSFLGAAFGGWNKKAPTTPFIAEDDTRQSPSDSPLNQTPESQRPFKEISVNSNERPPKTPQVETIDESSQTSLTADQIDAMLTARPTSPVLADESRKPHWSPPRGVATIPNALRVRKSQESIGSVGRAKPKAGDLNLALDIVPHKRPTSAGSGKPESVSSSHPPLPTDHKKVIAAATQRSGSFNGPGSMGPPPLPASALKANPSFRPRTPGTQTPLSPIGIGTTPRALQSTGYNNEVQSPSLTGRSRRSSVTSFASEVDTRFNLRAGMLPNGIEPGTDPRMINAITQTMIGEYLWKYTRRTGRGAMSENRHRRYFWVHPYTRTLYWSDRDPSQAGRAELKAKSVPIEAVRVVTDDNTSPPGLHRKSLVIVTPGRSVKFTASTGQRHETWFNALSYLLLRTGEEDTAVGTEVAAGALTREDVDEFNPPFGNSSTRGRPSLSSYNSRTTRNESPIVQSATSTGFPPQPQLTQSTSSRPTMGTLSRLSNYWSAGKDSRMASYSSKRSRHSVNGQGSIYEASEVHDSAEDLRQMIEKQDRESDKLENVRACCDGKHDVGHLHMHSVKGRTPSTQAVPTASSSRPEQQPPRTISRNSIMRRNN